MLMTAKEARKKALGINRIVNVVFEDLIAPVIEKTVQEGECLCYIEVGKFFDSIGCGEPSEEFMIYLVDALREYGYVVSCDWLNYSLMIGW